MEIAETATGGHGARLNSSSLVIVEFIMTSLAKEGTPAKVLYSYLQGFFTKNIRKLKFIRIKFDIDPEDPEPHKKNLSEVVETLNRSGSYDPRDQYPC